MKISWHYKFLFFTWLILPGFLYSCKKTGSIIEQVLPFKASFTIAEKFYESSRLLETDTVVTSQVFFHADGYYESYNWVIGDDPTIRTSRSFSLWIPLSESGKKLMVRLIAKKDNQVDTAIKHFTSMALKGTPSEAGTPHSIQLPYLGKFEGAYDDQPNHKFIIQFVNLGFNGNSGFLGFRVGNLPEGCGAPYVSGQPCILNEINTTHYSYGMHISYKGFFVKAGDDIGCCPKVEFLGYLDSINKNKIIVECSFINKQNPNVYHARKFTGYRL